MAWETKGFDIADGPVGADLVQNAERDQVLRAVQSFTQAGGAIEFAAVVFRPPGGFEASVFKDHRGIINDAGRSKAVRQCGTVNKGLEGGAGLAVSLNGTVKLIAAGGKA